MGKSMANTLDTIVKLPLSDDAEIRQIIAHSITPFKFKFIDQAHGSLSRMGGIFGYAKIIFFRTYKNIFRAKSHDGEFTASVLPSKNGLSVLDSYFL